MVFAIVLILGFATLLYARLGRWADATATSRKVNAEVLQRAKTAMIGYVAKEVLNLGEQVPGRFPCPESPGDAGTSNEGRAAASCAPTFATNKNIGRLPWRTLGIDKLTDASTEPLWYAVSPNWVFNGTPPLINAGTAGQLTFDGTSNVVAVIYAPGRLLVTSPNASQIAAGCAARNQSRNDRSHVPTGGNPDYQDYLECQNASSPIDLNLGNAIADNATNPVINDQAVVITAQEVLNAMQGPLAERLQRTVAPLLSEFGDRWIAGSKFMPYAVPFSPPEASLSTNAHCGSAAQTEGLLPIAADAAPCASAWTGLSLTGDGVNSLGCTGASPVACSFRYYRFTPLGQLLLGVTGAGSVTATVQGTAPNAAASFREPIALADVTVTAGAPALGGFSLVPTTGGDAALSFTATVSTPNLCRESLIGGLLCSTVAVLGLATTQTVTLEVPALGPVQLSGSKLSAGAMNGATGPFNLLSPASGDPHYWFMINEWYRYAYYAVSPTASAAQSGSDITVSGFPVENGSSNDKRFVLALMGPAVTGQVRSSTAAVNHYVEGQNAAAGSPRTFAYVVYAAPGNDRIATCPYTDGASSCD